MSASVGKKNDPGLRSAALLREAQRETLRTKGRLAASKESSSDDSSVEFGASLGGAALTAAAAPDADDVIDLLRRPLRKPMSKEDLRAWRIKVLKTSRRGAKLTKGVRKAIKSARVPRGIGGTPVARATPPHHEDIRTSKKNRAGSSAEDALAKWLRTGEGKGWIATRRARASAPELSLLFVSGGAAAASSGPHAPP